MDDLYNYIDKGGIIFSILLFFSAVGITLIIYKFFEITFFIDFNFKIFEDLLDKSHNIDDFKKSFRSKNRLTCAPPEPPYGLYLSKISYD